MNNGGNGIGDAVKAERIAISARDLAEETRARLHVVEQTQIAERNHQVSLMADVRALREEIRAVLGSQISDVQDRLHAVEFALEQQKLMIGELLRLAKGE